MKKRGQSSFEFIMMVAIAFAILIPALYFFYNSVSISQDKLVYSQIYSVGDNILSMSRSIYYMGEYSKDFIDLNLPKELTNITIYDNRELVFYFITKSGYKSMVLWSDVNITGVLPELDGVCCEKNAIYYLLENQRECDDFGGSFVEDKYCLDSSSFVITPPGFSGGKLRLKIESVNNGDQVLLATVIN